MKDRDPTSPRMVDLIGGSAIALFGSAVAVPGLENTLIREAAGFVTRGERGMLWSTLRRAQPGDGLPRAAAGENAVRRLDDPDTLAEPILRLLTDERERAEVGLASRCRAPQSSHDGMVDTAERICFEASGVHERAAGTEGGRSSEAASLRAGR